MAVKEVKIALGMLMTADDMVKLGVDIDCLNDIRDFLWDYFCAISRASVINKFIPDISWDHKSADITDTDLVIYFVRDQGASVIKKFATIPPDGGGLTAIDANVQGIRRNVSEVYVANNFPSMKLAKIALHELMHNKLKFDNNQLHSTQGVGIGQNGVSECAVQTAKDISLMAGAMGNMVKQYAAELPGGVPTKFVKPAAAAPAAVLVCSNGTKPGQGYLSPSERSAAKSAVDWSRVVRKK